MRSATLILLTATALFVFVGRSAACVCAGEESVGQAFKSSDAIFAATYVGSEYRSGIKNQFMEMRRSDGDKVDGYKVLVLKFEVKTWWKGAGTREVIITTSDTKMPDGSESISDCEFGFEKGKTYLVYANADAGQLYSGACTRTAELGSAHSDVRKLNAIRLGRKPFA
jgi:hypothetical protein